MLTFMKFVAHERLVEPECPQVVVPLSHKDTHDRLAEATTATLNLDDLAANRLNVIFLQISDLPPIREVFIIARKKEQQVRRRANVEPLQHPRPLRPNAAHILNRRSKQLGRR